MTATNGLLLLILIVLLPSGAAALSDLSLGLFILGMIAWPFACLAAAFYNRLWLYPQIERKYGVRH